MKYGLYTNYHDKKDHSPPYKVPLQFESYLNRFSSNLICRTEPVSAHSWPDSSQVASEKMLGPDCCMPGK